MEDIKQLTYQEFITLFDSIEKEFDVTDKGNGTGYYDSLCHARFKDSELRRFVDSDGRKGIIVPVITKVRFLKNRVYFERYSDDILIVGQHQDHHNLEELWDEIGDIRHLLEVTPQSQMALSP